MRTFASRTDKDLRIGVSLAAFVIFCILVLVGFTGILAAWSGVWPGDPPQQGYLALFLLLGQLPGWVVGIILVMVITLSTAAFDSLQSATVSTASNDFFRNKLNIWIIRAGVVLLIVPVVVVALKSPDILQIFLISDLFSAAAIPALFIGLSNRCYWWRGFDVVVGGLGGILTVFIFGTIYFGNAKDGGKLILLENGLYSGDWSAFGMYKLQSLCQSAYRWPVTDIHDPSGAFVAAPIGGLLWGFGALALRLTTLFILAKIKGHRFDALDKPIPTHSPQFSPTVNMEDDGAERPIPVEAAGKGKFF